MSISAPFTVTVGKDATTTAGAPSAATIDSGQAVTLYAVVAPSAPGAGTPTGFVYFMQGGVQVGAGYLGTVNGLTYTFFTTSSLSVGTHTFTAVYLGDASDQVHCCLGRCSPMTVTGAERLRVSGAMTAPPPGPDPWRTAPARR